MLPRACALVDVGGQLDAAGLAAPADLDLRLDHDGQPDRSATATASSTVSATPPGDTAMP